MALRSTRSLLLLAAAFLLFPGCDTSDPVPPVEPDEVVGVYQFTEFRFDPQGQGIEDADVLARLVESETSLELVSTQRGGQFQLRYRFEEDAFGDLVNGEFSVTPETVTLSVEEADVASLGALLLGQRIALERTSADVLSLSATRTVNLEAYDPMQYGESGLTNVSGTLQVELRRQGR